jgi:hypothetical protein
MNNGFSRPRFTVLLKKDPQADSTIASYPWSDGSVRAMTSANFQYERDVKKSGIYPDVLSI